MYERSNLAGLTYVIEKPNTPNAQFLVRMVPPGSDKLDHRPWRVTRDVLGYGESPDEATRIALRIRRCRP